jgi:hypothetical protein
MPRQMTLFAPVMPKTASWSMKEFQQAIRMKRQGMTCASIAAALGRSVAAVEAKLKGCGLTPVKVSLPRLIAAAATPAIAKPITRYGASHRDLTGAICGDPAIGYSALDRVAPTATPDLK